jgi:uncharacterized protein YcfL
MFHTMKYLFFLVFITVLLASCDKTGCTDINARNFDDKAESDDGNCKYNTDPFIGIWTAKDSIKISEDVYEADTIRTLDIRLVNLNKSKVRFFWYTENGIPQDTIDADSAPAGIIFDPQPFGPGRTIEGKFKLTYDGYMETEYTITIVADDLVTEYRGRADLKN